MKRMLALLLGTLAVPALTASAAPAPRLALSCLAAGATADRIDGGDVKVNGTVAQLGSDGAISGLNAAAVRGERASLPGRSTTFIAVPGAQNQACR